jgi:peptidoglycan-associated lipoprotein
MKEVFKAIFVLTLVAFVAIGMGGCRKKKTDQTVIDDTGVPPVAGPEDLSVFGADPNTAVYGKPIYFDFDKSDIKADAKPILEAIAMDLKANPSKYLLVEGHCDERGTNEYNLALGERRALSTREYLVSLGVVADMIVTISYGEERPIELGHDEAAWTQNRRAEFKTYVKQ